MRRARCCSLGASGSAGGCLSRCLSRCLNRCWCLRRRRLKRGRLWLALWSGSVGTSCFGLFLLPGGLPRRFGSGAASCAACGASGASGASCASCASGALSCLVGSILFNYTWSRYNTNDKDDPRSRTTLPSRSVRRKRMCLRVTGPLRAMKCPSSEPVSTMVPTPLFSVILERIDLVVRHHPDELKDLLPAGDEAWAQHVVP